MSAATIADRVAAACVIVGIPYAEIAGRGRNKQVVRARALIWWMLRQIRVGPITPSLPEIAAATGRPVHSTVITGLARITGKPREACLYVEETYRKLLNGERVRVLPRWVDMAAEELGI